MTAQRTWDAMRRAVSAWASWEDGGWLPLGLVKEGCGCVVDTLSGGQIWGPCMAHESEGHLAAVSESEGSHVARCLVLRCPWQETHLMLGDAIIAAQGHWRVTRAKDQR